MTRAPSLTPLSFLHNRFTHQYMPTKCNLVVLLLIIVSFLERGVARKLPNFKEAAAFQNGQGCPRVVRSSSLDDWWLIHIEMTLDATYLQSSMPGVFSVLHHASCSENIVFHFIVIEGGHDDIRCVVTTTFSYMSFRLYHLDSNLMKAMISYSIGEHSTNLSITHASTSPTSFLPLLVTSSASTPT